MWIRIVIVALLVVLITARTIQIFEQANGQHNSFTSPSNSTALAVADNSSELPLVLKVKREYTSNSSDDISLNGLSEKSGNESDQGGNQADKDLDARPTKIELPVLEEEIDARFESFFTEPSFLVPRIDVEHLTSDPSKLAPGVYFVGPYNTGTSGPQVFDQEGHLVYWGTDQTNDPRVKNFSPCDYLGEVQNHLCWSEVFYDELGHEYVQQKILDNTYTQVGQLHGAVRGWHFPNSHEFNMLAGGETFLQAVYQFKEMDLSMFGGPTDGWVHDGCFQEVQVEDSQLVFSWCALDHHSLDETYMYLDIPGQHNFTESIGGLGTYQKSWDYIHLNSVDKTPEGDYIVSSRHFNAVIKVAGKNSAKPGEIIWQLNGKSSHFEMQNFAFSRQHHVRYLSSSGSQTLISLFNNGFNIRNKNALEGLSSEGQIILLDETEMTAKLLHRYVHPDHEKGWQESVTIAEGSMSVLQNGGALIGWGSQPDITEYDRDSTVLFHASFANHQGRSYRAWKKPWIGKPHWAPKLLAYSQACGQSSLVAYVSWNGATEVHSWRFYVSPVSASGPWFCAGTFDKTGFETRADLSGSWAMSTFGFVPSVAVFALDIQGKVLGNTTSETFVPLPSLECSEHGCETRGFAYAEEHSCARTCSSTYVHLGPAAFVFGLFVLCLEMAVFLSDKVWRWCWTSMGSFANEDLESHNVSRSRRVKKSFRSLKQKEWGDPEVKIH